MQLLITANVKWGYISSGFVLAKDSVNMLKSMEARFHCGIKNEIIIIIATFIYDFISVSEYFVLFLYFNMYILQLWG